MKIRLLLVVPMVVSTILLFTGCMSPPINPDPDPVGCGIDSKEIKEAANRMALSIMNSPRVVCDHGTPRIVVDEEYFLNESIQVLDKAIFTDYLRVNLQQASNGRFEILERHFNSMVDDENMLEHAGEVTPGAVVKKTKRLGWDYRLGGAIRSISKVVPSTGARSNFFLITFELVERGTGRVVWSDRHEFNKSSKTSPIYR